MARKQKLGPSKSKSGATKKSRAVHRHRGGTEQERLRRIVESFSGISVLVLADLIADEFLTGEIARVSREAPVLVLKYRHRTIVPGGGANAIMNLAALGVTPLPVGMVGDDDAGRTLLQKLRKNRVSVSGITRLKRHTTTTKTRVLAYSSHSSRQQVLRIDRDAEALPESHFALRELVLSAREYAPAADAVLLSDYGYGACSPRMFEAVRARGAFNGIPVILDSRFRMLEYDGVQAATPNESEVEEALHIRIGNNRERLLEVGGELIRRMKLDSLVITRGSDGMAAFARRGQPVEIPVHGDSQVADVTGAGDTVTAVFTAALAAGADTASAARLANYAGGIVVMKRGTATVSREELLEAIGP